MTLILLAIKAHIAFLNGTIHDPAIPLGTAPDPHRQLCRKLNTVTNEPKQFKQPIILLTSNHSPSKSDK